MRIILLYHSLLSDWNNGNAHFLRGVVTELLTRGHQVAVWEPLHAWSVENLRQEHGEEPLADVRRVYPSLEVERYELERLDLDRALDGADLVIIHEWNDHDLVRRVGQHRALVGDYHLLFHDTHHRSSTDSASMAAYDLRHFDGVLVFGAVIRDIYLAKGWTQQAWVWHEAADTRVFRPLQAAKPEGDLVWIGNWGDEERSAELHHFLIEPVQRLRLRARVHGVRYPSYARQALARADIEYGGWLPNYRVPEVFAHFGVTVHIPRRPYVEALPGVPTIRIFEALACGIPLVCSPWEDIEELFTPGEDFLVAHDGKEMEHHLNMLLHEPEVARSLRTHGLATIRARHTCAHRVDELEAIYAELEAVQQKGR
jgi:spore maturation protein CgeB